MEWNGMGFGEVSPAQHPCDCCAAHEFSPCEPRMPQRGKGGGGRAALGLLCTLALTSPLAAHSPPPIVFSTDLNSDGVPEIITAEENHLTVTNGATATQLVRFHGEALGDGFGSVLLVIPDANGDGEPELLVAAPDAFGGAGALYLFQSPWMSPCSEFVSAEHADAVVRVPGADASASQFGETLRPMFDVDGDGNGEVQVSARSVNAQGEPSVRVYIFSPSRAEVLVQFDPIIATPVLPEVSGDVDADAEVTNADLTIVLENFTLPVPTRQSGDLDGDGVVGLTDLTEVITEFGRRGYEAIAPPPNAAGAVLCDLGSAGVAWVTPRASARMHLRIVETPGVEELAIDLEPLPGYFPPGFLLEGDLPFLMDCASDTRVQQALGRVMADCPMARDITVSAAACVPLAAWSFQAQTFFDCLPSRRLHIAVCVNGEDACGLFAHELLHAAQACALGFFDPSISCDEARARLRDPYHFLCRELEANRFVGLCSGEPGVSHAECCERICREYAKELGWRGEGCSINCVDCCTQFATNALPLVGGASENPPSPHCCSFGEWVCDDICDTFGPSAP